MTLDTFKRNYSSKQVCKLNHSRFENQISKLKQSCLCRRHMFHLKSVKILLAVLMFSGNCFANDLRNTKDIPRSAKQIYFHQKNLEKILNRFLVLFFFTSEHGKAR